MKKDQFVKEIIAQLRNVFSESIAAINDAAETATHEENVAKSKYETKSVEASYLVEGQLRRNAEIERDIAAFQAMKIRDFNNESRVLLSALITLESEDGSELKLFMAPAAGGMLVGDVQLITPPSPLGQAVLGKYCGDEVTLKITGESRKYKILNLN